MLLAVLLGAFGAHALGDHLTQADLAIYQTANHYHFYHALGLLILGTLWRDSVSPSLWRWAGWLMVVGTVIFSGSLYLLVLTGVGVWGAVTPVGGTALLGAWLLFILAFFRLKAPL